MPVEDNNQQSDLARRLASAREQQAPPQYGDPGFTSYAAEIARQEIRESRKPVNKLIVFGGGIALSATVLFAQDQVSDMMQPAHVEHHQSPTQDFIDNLDIFKFSQ